MEEITFDYEFMGFLQFDHYIEKKKIVKWKECDSEGKLLVLLCFLGSLLHLIFFRRLWAFSNLKKSFELAIYHFAHLR